MFTPDSTPTLVADSRLYSVLWAEFLAPVLSGDEPVVREIPLPSRADGTDFSDLGSVTRDASGEGWSCRVVAGDGWTAIVSRYQHRDASVTVRAANVAAAKAGVAAFASQIPDEEPTAESVEVDFWQVSEDVYRRTRRLEAPDWPSIANNYPDEVAAGFDRLLTTDFGDPDGRLVLWHGPPGTGKTTALRALARSWSERCRVQVLLDPERIFSASSTLFEVVTDAGAEQAGWRLLVIEDADELIRADAKERVGQSLARLLNLSDGLLGQGLKVMTLITTNEPVDQLHPALVRPGRCLAEVEFRAFTAEEARRRWPTRAFPPGPVTLAEGLYPEAEDRSASDSVGAGLYL